jgi:hypothetical protein
LDPTLKVPHCGDGPGLRLTLPSKDALGFGGSDEAHYIYLRLQKSMFYSDLFGLDIEQVGSGVYE